MGWTAGAWSGRVWPAEALQLHSVVLDLITSPAPEDIYVPLI